MTLNEFEDKYKSKGGFEALNMMRNELRTIKYIALHFGVSKTAVSLWMEELFGLKYDPRKLHKENRIDTMLKFASTHTEEEFREAYYYFNKHYFDIAYQEAISRNLFKRKD